MSKDGTGILVALSVALLTATLAAGQADAAGYGQCSWVEVGIKTSHGRGAPWCPQGTYMVQFDLDGDRSLSGHDAPIVGRAKCCQISGQTAWNWCSGWQDLGVDHQAKGGHQPTWTCPPGSFLVQFDLDGERRVSAHDAPVIGAYKCCGPRRPPAPGEVRAVWENCNWHQVGIKASHGTHTSWCPEGGYLVGFDLDGERSLDSHDAPIVGQAYCCGYPGQ